MNNHNYTPIINSSNNLESNNKNYTPIINSSNNLESYNQPLNNWNVRLSHQMSNTNSNYLNNQNYSEHIHFNNSLNIPHFNNQSYSYPYRNGLGRQVVMLSGTPINYNNFVNYILFSYFL